MRLLLINSVILFITSLGYSQVTISSDPNKNNDRLAFATGLTFSSNHFEKDPGTTAKRGLFTQLTWHPVIPWRFSLEYTRHFNYNIGITWNKVKSNDIDLNTHLITFLPDGESYFYPLVGLNYNTWNATYTGLFKPVDGNPPAVNGERVYTHLIRANLGCGMEFKLNDYISLLGEFRFRLNKGEQRNTIEISDAMYKFGANFALSTIHFKKREHEDKINVKGKRYKWF